MLGNEINLDYHDDFSHVKPVRPVKPVRTSSASEKAAGMLGSAQLPRTQIQGCVDLALSFKSAQLSEKAGSL